MKYIEITQDDIDEGRKNWGLCQTCPLGLASQRVGLFWSFNGYRPNGVWWCVATSPMRPFDCFWTADKSLDHYHTLLSHRFSGARPGYIVLDDATMTASYVERLPLQPDWSAIVHRAREEVRSEATALAAEAHEFYQGVEV